MNTETWTTIEEYFRKATRLGESEIQAFLESIESPEVRARVSSLIARRRQVERFLTASAAEISHGIVDPDDEEASLSGVVIGNYRVVREIARGGMGAVYLAERADGEFEGRAALKLLRGELDSEDFRRRFKYEVQVLSGLKHAFIASLLDAGTSEEGVPYIAMEFVDGIPLDEYCRENHLTIPEILRLFQKVCDAVSHAHRNLIVHRDLKPSNILITNDGSPKLLDFGISKILTNNRAENDLHTVTRLGAMTPEFAAPEQLRAEQVVTTADIYSLGVILYLLLTGRRPFEFEGNQFEFVKAVCESESVAPSAVYQSEASRNQTNYPMNADAKSLIGDLDKIVLKALKKEPERRFASVDQFSQDIQRFLEGRPVLAQNDTLRYRLSKFIVRNRVAAMAGLLAVLILAVGISAVIRQSHIAQAERDRARIEEAKAEKINEFLQGLLNFSNPSWISSNPERNRNATISEALDLASERAELELANEPEVLAAVQFTLGSTYLSQGRYKEAERHLRSAVKGHSATLGASDSMTLRSGLALADALLLQGKYQEAELRYREIIPGLKSVAAEEDSERKWLAAAHNDLGLLLNVTGRTEEAEQEFREVLASAEELKENDRSIIPIALGNLGLAYRDRGDLRGALEIFQRAENEYEKLSRRPSFEFALLLNNIAIVQKLIGKFDEAESNSKESYEMMLDTVGKSHQYTAYPLIQLSDIYYRKGKFQKSLEFAQKALEIQKKLLNLNHNDISYTNLVLGKAKTSTGRLSEGEKFLRRSLKTRNATLKKPHYLKAEVFLALGENLSAQERNKEALDYLSAAESMLAATVGREHPTSKESSRALLRLESKLAGRSSRDRRRKGQE